MKNYQKTILCFLLAVLLLTMGCADAAMSAAPYERVLRLHILANSDSEEDQRVKLLVRDAVTAYERAQMSVAQDKEEAKAELMADGADLQAVVEEVLMQNGCGYGASLYAGRYAFPERDYGEITYPAGEYEALRIVLGSGSGQNWWCVMFPPLCILEGKEGKIETEQFKFDSLLKKLLKRSEEKDGSVDKKDSADTGTDTGDSGTADSGGCGGTKGGQ